MSLPPNFKETNQHKQEIKCRWCHDTRLYQPLIGDAIECLECKPVPTPSKSPDFRAGYVEVASHSACFATNQDGYICTAKVGHFGAHVAGGSIPLRVWT